VREAEALSATPVMDCGFGCHLRCGRLVILLAISARNIRCNPAKLANRIRNIGYHVEISAAA
jgi:hypothetical protein